LSNADKGAVGLIPALELASLTAIGSWHSMVLFVLVCNSLLHSFSIMSGGLWEFDHEINTERIPPRVRNGERLKLANWRVSPRFSLEAEIAGTYILADIPRHLRPPVVPRHQF